MKWFWRCTSIAFLAAAPRSGVSFSVTKLHSKKSLRAAEQQRADVARARRRWMREQGMFDPARLVFIDETAANTKMVRLYGRCPRGERLIDRVPQGHWKTITFVAALRRNGMRAPCTVDGSMNGARFLAYVEQCLAPILKRKDIVMIDNLPAHKAAGIREAIEARGATLRYLPQSSPDLNPIEMPFSKLKASLRKAAERTIILCLPIAKTTSSSVRSGCFSIRPNRKSACFSNGEMLPPRGLAAQRPVCRKHLTQITAVLALTANSSAASRREAPLSTSAITRSRISPE